MPKGYFKFKGDSSSLSEETSPKMETADISHTEKNEMKAPVSSESVLITSETAACTTSRNARPLLSQKIVRSSLQKAAPSDPSEVNENTVQASGEQAVSFSESSSNKSAVPSSIQKMQESSTEDGITSSQNGVQSDQKAMELEKNALGSDQNAMEADQNEMQSDQNAVPPIEGTLPSSNQNMEQSSNEIEVPSTEKTIPSSDQNKGVPQNEDAQSSVAHAESDGNPDLPTSENTVQPVQDGVVPSLNQSVGLISNQNELGSMSDGAVVSSSESVVPNPNSVQSRQDDVPPSPDTVLPEAVSADISTEDLGPTSSQNDVPLPRTRTTSIEIENSEDSGPVFYTLKCASIKRNLKDFRNAAVIIHASANSAEDINSELHDPVEINDDDMKLKKVKPGKNKSKNKDVQMDQIVLFEAPSETIEICNTSKLLSLTELRRRKFSRRFLYAALVLTCLFVWFGLLGILFVIRKM